MSYSELGSSEMSQGDYIIYLQKELANARAKLKRERFSRAELEKQIKELHLDLQSQQLEIIEKARELCR